MGIDQIGTIVGIIGGGISILAGIKTWVLLPRQVSELEKKNDDIFKRLDKGQQELATKEELEDAKTEFERDNNATETAIRRDLNRIEELQKELSVARSKDHDLLIRVESTINSLKDHIEQYISRDG